MSYPYEHGPDENEDDYTPPTDEPDPGVVAFLDQETEQFNDDAEQFAKIFGFEHLCTCAQDYTEGRMTETTECFGRLCLDALGACKRLKEERDMLVKVLTVAVKQQETDDAEGDDTTGS